jgi:hypothetical protein
MDDDTLIVLEESNVEQVLQDVLVYEEKLKEKSVLVLNKEQIINELTNLLLNKHKNIKKVAKKVHMYLGMFEPSADDVVYKDNLHPIVLCKKIVTIHGDKNDIYDEADEEYQDTYFLHAQQFKTFIKEFKDNNEDKSNPYLNTVKTLYNITKPFLLTNDTSFVKERVHADAAKDAYRHFIFEEYNSEDLAKRRINKLETFRLIEPTIIDTSKRPEVPDDKPGCTSGLHYLTSPVERTIYDGDKIDVVGYVNVCEHDKNINYFDFLKYFSHLEQLDIQTKVQVLFNDFVFDKAGKLIRDIDATVANKLNGKITLKFAKNLIINSEESTVFTFDIYDPVRCYIYSSKYTGFRFNKPCINKHTIVFPLSNKTQTPLHSTKRLIVPVTMSEILYVNLDTVRKTNDFNELRSLLSNESIVDFNKITVNLSKVLDFALASTSRLPPPKKLEQPNFHFSNYINHYDILNFSKYQRYLNHYKDQYHDAKTFVDSALSRYSWLKSKNDYGYLYMLKVIKVVLAEKIAGMRKHEPKFVAELDAVKVQLTSISDKLSDKKPKEKPPRIVKRYDSIFDVEQDNGKELYVEKDLDNTKYELINDIDKSLKGKDLVNALVEKLSREKDTSKALEELQFHAESILLGKTKVRPGDNAVVYLEDGASILYVRRLIHGVETWARLLKAPFPICATNIHSIAELEMGKTIAFDPFDQVCKKVDEIKLNAAYHSLFAKSNAIDNCISIIHDLDSIIQEIDEQIQHYESEMLLLQYDHLQALENMRRPVKIVQDYHQKENLYDDYIGDSELLDFDNIFNNADFNDNTGFQYLHQTNPQHNQYDDNVPQNFDILDALLQFMGIDMDKKNVEMILEQVNTKHPYEQVSTKIQKYKEWVLSKANKQMYGKDAKYTKEFDDNMAKMVANFEAKELKAYYKKTIPYTAATLSLVIMIRYPHLMMKKIVPRCAKHFSYIGHPISNKDPSQSLTKYLACIIATIGIPGDMRFEQFRDVTVAEIETNIKDDVDNIIENNATASQNFEQNKELLLKIKTKAPTDYDQYKILNITFKPNFNFKVSSSTGYSNNIVKYLKAINDMVQKAEVLKSNLYNNPFLTNSCCVEQLQTSTNFYDFFAKDTDFKKLHLSTSRINNNFAQTVALVPTSKIPARDDVFFERTVNVTNYTKIKDQSGNSLDCPQTATALFLADNGYFADDNTMSSLEANLHNEDWWQKVFYPNLNDLFNIVIDFVKKYNDKVNIDLVNQLNAIVVSLKVDSSHVKSSDTVYHYHQRMLNLRNSLLAFVKTQLPSLLAKVVNKKVLMNNEDGDKLMKKPHDEMTFEEKLSVVLATTQGNAGYNDVLDRIRNIIVKMLVNTSNLFFNSDNNEEVLIKNISVVVYVLFKVMFAILYVTIHEEYTNQHSNMLTIAISQTSKKKLAMISSELVYFILETLHNFINVNDSDNDKIKKRVEELREKRKQAMIAAYSADDEARKLQILLKKMGLNTVDPDAINADADKTADKSDDSKTKDIMKTMNDLQDQANYDNSDYLGENADGDEVEEQYVTYTD